MVSWDFGEFNGDTGPIYGSLAQGKVIWYSFSFGSGGYTWISLPTDRDRPSAPTRRLACMTD